MYLQDLITCNTITISKNCQNDLNFGGSQIQTPEIAITFYYRIVDGHTEFPHCTVSLLNFVSNSLSHWPQFHVLQTFFSSPGPKGPCELLPSLGVRRTS
jgi:hypothetical protein